MGDPGGGGLPRAFGERGPPLRAAARRAALEMDVGAVERVICPPPLPPPWLPRGPDFCGGGVCWSNICGEVAPGH